MVEKDNIDRLDDDDDDEQDEPHNLQWIFQGNVIVPVGNPFLSPSPDNEAQQNEAPNHPLEETATTPFCTWLGPGLQLLTEHVLAVNAKGVITHLQPASCFWSSPNGRRAKQQEAIRVELSSKNEFLCPGLIDLHIHAPQFAFTGTATDRVLTGPQGWLETYTFPSEQRMKDDNVTCQQVYEQVVQTTLRYGTTTALYFATLDLEPCKVLVDCVLKFGQRALVGKVCMDRNSPSSYCQSLEQNIQETKDLMTYIESKGVSTVLPVLTPRFIPTCTPELLSELGQIAQLHRCHVTTHVSESHDEVAWSRELCQGQTDAQVLDAHGLLVPNRCVLAHGVHLTEADCELLKQRRAALAHCPLSNFFFANGALPCRKLLQSGQLVGLGTDVAGGYSPSMWNAARMAVVASRALSNEKKNIQGGGDADDDDHGQGLDYRHAFYMATLGGATALGMQDRIGTFRVGMEFDALVLSVDDNNKSQRQPVPVFDTDSPSDVFQKICNLGDDRNVKRVFVQGKDVTGRL